MKNTLVSPSLLSANFANLEADIKKVEDAGADWLHFDVMDGHFVPNISFGLPVLKSISKKHNMVNDVHLMISNPTKYAKRFIEAGADYLTFHYEAVENEQEMIELINIIHENNAKVGVSIKPNTPATVMLPLLDKIDMVLVMSVEPGFGGQSFMESALDKIALLKKYINDNNINCLVEVDGGVDGTTGPRCVSAGADVLVAGSYIFGKENIKERIESLRK